MPEPRPTSPPAPDFDHLRAVLLRCVRRCAPAWMQDSSEDIVQRALMRLSDKVHDRPQGESYPTSYLMKVANHAVIDEIRKLRRRREVPYDDLGGEPAAAVTAVKPRTATDIAIGDGISDCMTHLNEDRRTAVTLNLIGHSVPETAGLLGWTRKRSENLVFRGLAALRECLRRKELVP